ncbi:unnamed protein product [Coregonus sp. 'balchen']|uniref:Uncharacterized protein n=1 Tax=Coregonus suidteri TaxID=861788 RepID=A0AAN8MBM5_9TELE|nr:unnamed protein product [Coregonus sp. 'balchen']
MVVCVCATFVSMGKFSSQLLGISELLWTEDGDRGCWASVVRPPCSSLPPCLSSQSEKAIRRLWGSKDHNVEVE